MFEDAKIGDKVYSLTQGWGEVIEYETDGEEYPLIVEFEYKGIIERFTIDGRIYNKDKYPALFWNEIAFVVPDKPLPDLEVDTKVIVWNIEGYEKRKRYFKKFDENGKIVCFNDGTTSWSNANNKENSWNYWELAE